jgi:LPXTG-motif cell wall-anchored protein
MRKIKLIMAALGVSLVAMLALAPVAQAQQPTVASDPPFVSAAGEHEFNLTGAGWIEGMVAIVPCTDNTYEGLVANGAGNCDTGALTMAPAGADGTFSATVTYDIPAEGMCIGVGGGAAFTEQGGGYCVGVGAPILPNTGSESGLIVVIGAAVLAAGALVVGMSRRRAFVS